MADEISARDLISKSDSDNLNKPGSLDSPP